MSITTTTLRITSYQISRNSRKPQDFYHISLRTHKARISLPSNGETTIASRPSIMLSLFSALAFLLVTFSASANAFYPAWQAPRNLNGQLYCARAYDRAVSEIVTSPVPANTIWQITSLCKTTNGGLVNPSVCQESIITTGAAFGLAVVCSPPELNLRRQILIFELQAILETNQLLGQYPWSQQTIRVHLLLDRSNR